MADEYIRLDTTIMGIDGLINEAPTGPQARALLCAKDMIYDQQRYVSEMKPVKRGRWIDIHEYCKMNGYIPSGVALYFWCSECMKEQEKTSDFCPHCGADMREPKAIKG